MSNATRGAAVFGAFDGLTSAVGVVTAALVAGASAATIGATAGGLAVAATVSMAGGEWLSEGATNWAAVGAMGAATLAGSFLPAAPLIALGRGWGTAAAGAATVAGAVGIGEARRGVSGRRRWRAHAETWLVMVAAAGLAVAVGLALGAAG